MVKNSEGAANPETPPPCGARELPRTGGAVDFERLYQMHGKRVYTLCRRMVGDKTDAEDLTQEVFIQLLRKIDTYRGEAAFTTWLHRLAVNVVLMNLRKKSRIEPPIGEGTERGEERDGSSAELRAPDPPPGAAIDRLDIEHALAQLPAGYRMVLVLHDVEGYQHGEIARVLGVNAGTSKSQLHKARIRLRALLCMRQEPAPAGGCKPHLPKRRAEGAHAKESFKKPALGIEPGMWLSAGEQFEWRGRYASPRPGENETALGIDEAELAEVTQGKTA